MAKRISKMETVIGQLIDNELMTRSQLVAKLTDPRRDIDKECGYPDSISDDQYQQMFDRNGIARRLVSIFPDECWAVDPIVFETMESEKETVFEAAWKSLAKDVGGDSWLVEQQGNPVFHYLHRVDVLSGIGRYGILLLGLDDGKQLSEPADGIDEKGRKVGNPQNRLVYLQVFPESKAKIVEVEKNSSNPRYGKPTVYDVAISDTATVKVHWTRVVHIADNRETGEVYGVPRMQQHYNRLWDLQKILGASAEGYWQSSFPGYSIETQPGFEDAQITDELAEDLREQVYRFMNSLQRWIRLTGFSVKTLSPQVVSPSDQFQTQVRAICAAEGIPYRIFLGSEEAKLASTQDKESWIGRVKARQTKYLTPMVIAPFVDRLVMLGVLPEPERYYVDWPDLSTPSDKDKAEVAERVTGALAKYVQGGVDALIPPADFLTLVLGMSAEEVEAVLQAAAEGVEG